VRYNWGSTPTDYTYTGQYSNVPEFGLMFYNARWYDPGLGRFAQADTIIPEQSQGTQAWDRYAYTNNNPLKYTDPSGHGVNFAVCAVVGAVIGGVSYAIGAAVRGNFDGMQFAASVGVGIAGGLLVASGVGLAAGSAMLSATVAGAGIGAVTAEAAYNLTASEYDTGDMLIATGVGTVAGAASGALGATSLAGTTTGFLTETAINGLAGGSQHLLTELNHGSALDENLLLESATIGLMTAGATGIVSELSQPFLPSYGSQIAHWSGQSASSRWLSQQTVNRVVQSLRTSDAITGVARGVFANTAANILNEMR
jgi:RHS repeat-associated protein